MVQQNMGPPLAGPAAIARKKKEEEERLRQMMSQGKRPMSGGAAGPTTPGLGQRLKGAAMGYGAKAIGGAIGGPFGSIIAGLFNEGGQVNPNADPMGQMPPEAQQAIMAFMQGQLPPEQLVQVLSQVLGIPAEQAAEIVAGMVSEMEAQGVQPGAAPQPGADPMAQQAQEGTQALFNIGGNVRQHYNTGGMPEMQSESIAMPTGGPVKSVKQKTKVVKGHNTEETEMQLEFDTKAISEMPSPPMSSMAKKALGLG